MFPKKVRDFFYGPKNSFYGTTADVAGLDIFLAHHMGFTWSLVLSGTLLILLSPWERTAPGFFWGLIVSALIGESFPYRSSLRYHRRVILLVSWIASWLALSICFWDYLEIIDKYTHAFRESPSLILNLDQYFGRKNLHTINCCVFFGGLAIFSFCYDLFHNLSKKRKTFLRRYDNQQH